MESLKQQDQTKQVAPDGCGTEVKRILLSFLLYNIPLILAVIVIVGCGGYSAGGRGILRGYTLILSFSLYSSGLLVCLGLTLWFKWWGVVLAPAVGVLLVILLRI